MKSSLKLKLVAAVLMASDAAHAGVANVGGDGSVGNAYNMGVIGALPSVLAATLAGSQAHFSKNTRISPFRHYRAH